jgi:iron complex outermembrane receptor protein
VLKILFAFTALLFSVATFGQAHEPCRYKLAGRVTTEAGQPLAGATVFLRLNNRGIVTDAEGRFALTAICLPSDSAEIKFVGFVTERIKVDLARKDFYEIPLAADLAMLSEVVVTEAPAQTQATQTYSVLTGDALAQLQGKPLGEVMRDIAGINTLQTGPAIFKPVIHGVHSQRILILNNGIRQEGQQWGAEHAPEIDPFVAGDITVIKDAGAIKYGTDALGGVVVVNPAELPTRAGLGGKLFLMANSNGRGGTVSGLIEGGSKKVEGLGWRLQGTGKRSGDFSSPTYILSNTGFKEANFSGSVGVHRDQRGIEAFISHFQTTIGILRGSAVETESDLTIATEREPPQYTAPFTYAILQPRQEVAHTLLKLSAHQQLGNNLYQFQYGFQYNNRQEFDFRKGDLRNIPALGFKLFTNTFDGEWEHTKNENRVRCAGLNGMIQVNEKIDGTQTIPFIPNFTHLSAGLYWIEKLTWRQWAFDVGARYDLRFYDVAGFDFRNELFRAQLNFGNASATAGATYRLSPRTRLSSSLGSTWRPPSVAELYSLGTHQSAASIEYGLLLDEQTTRVSMLTRENFNIEHGLKWVSSWRTDRETWSVEVAGYANYIFNYIYLKPRGVTRDLRGVRSYYRYAQTDAAFVGIDLASELTLTTTWKWKSKASLLQATDVTQNDYLVFIPPSRFESGLAASGNRQQKKWNAEAKVRHTTRQHRAPRVLSNRELIEAKVNGVDLLAKDGSNFDFLAPPPAYTLLSFSAGLTWPAGKAECDVRLSVDNAFNKIYREYTNRLRYFANEVGRNVTLAFSVKF